MDNFQIETAQNVTITQNVAGILDRILALIVDYLIIAVYLFVIIFILIQTEWIDSGVFLFYMTVGLPVMLYHLLWETFWNGQTPGKAALKIRVVKLDGSRPAFSNYLLRWLLRVVDISISFGAVALVTILFNGKGQRLGDIAATTTVISEKTLTPLRSFRTDEIPDDYVPKYPQVIVFKDKDIQSIKTIYFQARAQGNHHIILKLSDRVAKIMDIKFDEKPVEFIQKVLRDYTFYTQQL